MHPLRQSNITIRHFTDDDLSQLWRRKNSVESYRPKWQRSRITDPAARRAFDHMNIRTALNLIKPYTLRRTIPGIFTRTNSGKEVLVGLPTLGCAVHDGVMGSASRNKGLPWEIRYKKVDLGNKDVKEVVVCGMKEDDVRKSMRSTTTTGHRTPQVRMCRDPRR